MARSDGTCSHAPLLFLDVDGLRTVNDTYGHQIGDRLLAGIGQRVRSAADARMYAAKRARR